MIVIRMFLFVTKVAVTVFEMCVEFRFINEITNVILRCAVRMCEVNCASNGGIFGRLICRKAATVFRILDYVDVLNQ